MKSAVLRTVNSHIEKGHLDRAKKELDAAIKEHPGFFLYWRKHADVCRALGMTDQAARSRARSINLSPPTNYRHAPSAGPLEGPDHRGVVHEQLMALPEVIAAADGMQFCGRLERAPIVDGRKLEGGRRLRGGERRSRPGEPLVTIVTVVYNNADTLERCIGSVVAQDYGNIEYIVIDGGSESPTLDIILAHADNIDYYVSEPDKGIYDAMNKGISLARGEYVCLLNSDDFYKPDFVRRSIEMALESDSAVVYSHYIHGDAITKTAGINEGIFLGHLNINHSTFLVHRAVYDLVGPYSDDYKIVSDAEWMRSAFARRIRFDLLDAALFVFAEDGLSSGNTEARRKLFISEVVSTYRRWFSFLSPDEAEEIYLLRFNSARLGAVLDIAQHHSGESGFLRALGCYVDFCMRSRPAFKLKQGDYESKFRQYVRACRMLGVGFDAIDIPTKRGSFSTFLGGLSDVIATRKSGSRNVVLHFLSVFSAPSETFIYDLINQLENDTSLDNFVLYEHKKLEAERPYPKALWVPWNDFHEDARGVIYEHVFRCLNPDVVIGHFALNTWKLYQRLAPLGISRPTVTMTHGIDVFMLSQGGEYRDFILNDLSRRNDAVFSAVSVFLKQRLVAAGVAEELIEVVPNAANRRFLEYRRRPRSVGNNDCVKLLAIGRLIDWKGHACLLRSIALVRDRIALSIHLTIVYGGGDELLGDLNELAAELDIAGIVEFLPFVDFERRPDFHAGFDMFVHPSTYSSDTLRRTETFGVAVLEAIGAGLPVVATDAGGVPEVIGNPGCHAMIVPHGDETAFADAIVKMLEGDALAFSNEDYAMERFDTFSDKRRLAGVCRLLNKAIGQKIRVAIFSTSTIQGAGYAAYRLHRGLLKSATIESRIYTTVRNHEDAPGVTRVAHPSGDGARWNWIQQGRISKPNLTIFTINYPILSNRQVDALVGDADVINLHWIARFLSVENIIHLTRSDKPVVMTIRDMQPITGGCHYFHGCSEWTRSCTNCPQLLDNWDNFPAKILEAKRRGYDFDNLTLVALSHHTKEILARSPGFSDCRIEVIPNSIEIDIFKSPGKTEARKQLGLPQERKIIGYVPSFSSDVKGFREVMQAFDLLKKSGSDPLVLLVGNKTPATDGISLDKHNLGYIADNRRLALAYAAADVVVVPSLEETFSNTTAEAIACGTPVVGFRTGAIHQMVKDGITGYTYEPGDVVGLARGLVDVLNGPDLSGNCRAYAERELRFGLQASRYEALFTELFFAKARRTATPLRGMDDLMFNISQSVVRMVENRAFEKRS